MHLTSPDIAYLIIHWEVGYTDINLLMDVLVVLMQIENNILGNIFKNFKDWLRCISQPDGNIWMNVYELLVINLQTTLISCTERLNKKTSRETYVRKIKPAEKIHHK